MSDVQRRLAGETSPLFGGLMSREERAIERQANVAARKIIAVAALGELADEVIDRLDDRRVTGARNEIHHELLLEIEITCTRKLKSIISQLGNRYQL